MVMDLTVINVMHDNVVLAHNQFRLLGVGFLRVPLASVLDIYVKIQPQGPAWGVLIHECVYVYVFMRTTQAY